MSHYLQIAHLDEESVAKIRALEAETGKHIMAFTSGLDFASLEQAQIDKVKALEGELGVTLLVYDA